ncbi:hypothetical protein Tco_1470980 [Tanacetum coccineum]
MTLRFVLLRSTGLPSTLDEGTRAVKTTPFLEGPRRDKDSEGLKPPAYMEPQTNPVADPSGTEDIEEDTQADEEQHQSPPPNTDKSKPSPDQETQESECDSSSPELKKYDNILPLTERQLIKASIEGYYEENVDHKEQTDKVIDAAMNSLDKNSIARSDLINALNGVTKTLKAIQDVVKEDLVLNKKMIKATEAYTKNFTHLTELLTLIKNFDFLGLKSSVESLHATALSEEKHLAEWAKSSTFMAWNLSPRMTAIENSQDEIRTEVSSLRQDTSDIKSMMIEIY